MWLKRLSFLVLGFIIAFFSGFSSEICSKSSSYRQSLDPYGDAEGQETLYKIDWDVLDSEGGKISSNQFLLLNSLGQPLTGESNGGEFSMGNGYWYLFQSFIAGDINGDGIVNVSDIVYIANYLVKSGPPPKPFWVGDVNCDTWINLSDPVYLANYLFKSGPPPCADP